jgi:ubiquinone biosynthesis protein
MKWFEHLKRLLHIKFVLARHRLDRIVLSMPLLTLSRFFLCFSPRYWSQDKTVYARGVHIRQALEELGPIFVKFGQLLSTRRDLLPDDIADELAKLQDQVPPFSGELAQSMLEKIYNQPITELFASFDLVPLASASVAQVHAVRLHDGKEAVVKILRPNIEKTIRSDIALLYTIARLTERYWSEGYRLRPQAVVTEFEQTILAELDLMHEAANASQLRRNFPNSPLLHVPEIYWPYARQSAIVMERIYGIPATNIDELKQAGINMKRLAERGVEIFFTQVFRDSFFHADMHPGNILVSLQNKENPQYIAVDFGIMGTLSPHDQRYIAENLLAFFKRDYRRVATLHVESGWVGPDTRVDQLEAAIRTVCEPVFERPFKEISVGKMLLSLFQAAGRFNMHIQPQLILLQKTLLNVEGMGRQIYPELDLWNTAMPYLEHWVREQIGFKAFFKKVRDNLPYWTERLPELPDLIYEVVRHQKQELLRREAQATQKPAMQKSTTVHWFVWGLAIGAGVFAMVNYYVTVV